METKENSGQLKSALPQKKRKKIIWSLIISGLLWPLGIGIFFASKGCTEDAPAIVNLVLKEDGKTYLFSNLGADAVAASLERNESPTSMHFLKLYVDDKLYIPPADIKEVVNMMAGNYKIHPYKEKSCDGYVTSGDEELFEFSSKNEMTENIGEQIVKSSVIVKRPDARASFKITWERNADGEIIPTKNCELVSFWVETNPDPGTSVYNTEDILLVDLDNLNKYFGNKAQLSFDEENKVLYIKR